ncbi:UNVERIFIED_CONTAM: hypothetical protein PYX00_011213 [Menopon gallinae]|uniref:ATP-dependent DNA helicase RecG n=1 Tax=Menopon gallinae TaxID=328185 RepID=A0AAW2H6P4_9NEOP
MNRLLQGDVGSGFKVALLSASLQGKEKRETYQAIQEGKVHIIFGTHSLFSQSLEFHCLGYVIVDEQQKFGLAQREKLKEKGIQADVLVMSATPIPRTMALMLMELTPVSTLYSQAIAKEPIQTFLVERSNRKRAYEFSLKELNKGHQVYVVHPIIEGSASCYLPSIQEFYKELQSSFSSYSVALLHSRLKDEQKIQIMQDFSLHKIDLLLSTSMVEVGMDVPNATVMMISGAEYFGLASLHQLRGRVGRGEQPSYCFLIYSLPLEENAKKRLKLIRESEDGFYLAQEDLKMRGSGDFISDKQSGKLCLKLFDLEKNEELFLAIKNEAMLYFSSEGSIPEEEKQALYQAIKERLAK